MPGWWSHQTDFRSPPDLFRSRAALEAEILVLRQQIIVLRRGKPGPTAIHGHGQVGARVGLPAVFERPRRTRHRPAGDRSALASRGLSIVLALEVERRPGRPVVTAEIRQLIREMSIANPLWGAPRIHGELLKLGIDIGQTSVAKYMARRRGPPSQGWKTFLRNHADGIAAMDLFVVPTVSFRLLYGLLIMGHGRRQILWLGVTAHPTAEWIANQLTEACGWEWTRDYLIRDRDACYGNVFIRRLRSLGIRDHPTSPRSPWQNGYAERLIGSIRRECLDHVVVSESGTCVMCCLLTWNTTTMFEHTYRWRRTRRPCARARRTHPPGLSSAVCIINMSGFDLW